MVRAGGTAPMASRTIRLYIEDSPTKRFMGIASDYVYGHSALDSFEKEIKDLGRQYLGNIYAPLNTKDFSSYIARIKKEKPEILYVALIGDDIHNFFRQAKGYGLLEEVQPMFEQIYLFYVLPLGDLLVGVIGSTRYTCTFDNPENKKFVQKFYSAFKEYPDIPDGEVYHSMGMLFKAIEKAGTADDVQAIIKAYEGLEYTGIKGRVVMRACDHQATNPGVMVKLIKSPDYPHPIPQVIKVYPGEKVIPSCRKETFD
jgi:branched-chain amino acid transport system substrate-binding protein